MEREFGNIMVTDSVVKLVNADKLKPIFFPSFSGLMRADLGMTMVHFSSILVAPHIH